MIHTESTKVYYGQCFVFTRLNCPKLRGQVLEDSAIVDNSVEDSVGNPGGHENGGKIESADHSGSVDWMMAQVTFANGDHKLKLKIYNNIVQITGI